MNKTLVIIILSTFFTLYGETTIFSSLGIGDIKNNSYMNLGFANFDSLALSDKNFATWSKLNNVTYNVSFSYFYNVVDDDFTSTSTNYDHLSVSGFNFALPISRSGHTIGLSISPFALSDIMTISPKKKLETTFPNESEIYLETLETKISSINSASLIYAGSISDFSFSASFGCTFGSVNKNMQYNFYNESENGSFDIPQIFSDYFETNFYAFNFGLGTFYKFRNLSLGGSITLPFHKSAVLITKENTDRKIEKNFPDFDWPLSYGFGAGYQISKNWKTAVDFEYIEMSKINLAQDDLYEDYFKLTSKIYYRKKYRITAPFYEKIGYNLGFSINNRGVKDPIYQNRIKEETALVGITIPYNKQRSALDLNFGITKSGDKGNNLMVDYIYKLQISLNNSGNWWLREKEY